jgi:hypothetical protein
MDRRRDIACGEKDRLQMWSEKTGLLVKKQVSDMECASVSRVRWCSAVYLLAVLLAHRSRTAHLQQQSLVVAVGCGRLPPLRPASLLLPLPSSSPPLLPLMMSQLLLLTIHDSGLGLMCRREACTSCTMSDSCIAVLLLFLPRSLLCPYRCPRCCFSPPT